MADEEEPAETDNNGIIPVFASLQDFLSSDQDIREEIRTVTRELEQCAREVLAVLQGVHQTPNDEAVKKICTKGRKMLDGAKSHYGRLIEKIPTGQYYRFCDHWRFACQRFSFLGAFLVYLESERLITRAELAEMLGVQVERASGGFHIDLDDFLTGLLLLANELSRFAVNSVTAADYARPFRIAMFMAELDAGFRLLNLKNDSLRKKFDGLKYDLKKVEEVVYDLTIRGLKPACGETDQT
ncbi:Translin [Acropora cervicornis]|uniref:Translin n=1 Tax=Acropora cervicornis TaxID=6130 RepID=A0AAD9USX8_ACRCE|nr:Translin [Acropora cervicornis]